MRNASQEKIASFLREKQAAETAFLAELVKVPSDNPPGDCALHAKRAAELLEGLGFKVEQHPVPDDAVRANGMTPADASRICRSIASVISGLRRRNSFAFSRP